MTDLIGWFAAAVLLATIGRQVYTQWRNRSAAGLSRWLFIGQITASAAFVIYSWQLGSWVFVVTNLLMLVTAVLGQWVFLSNRGRLPTFPTEPYEGNNHARDSAVSARRAHTDHYSAVPLSRGVTLQVEASRGPAARGSDLAVRFPLRSAASRAKEKAAR